MKSKENKTSAGIVSVILAAGKSTRMGSGAVSKVCLPVQGKPVISRAVDTFRRCGIGPHFIVVGHEAERVMTVASAAGDDVFFCFQAEQRGTGHAAKSAARLLSSLNYQGRILVVAGDKIIQDDILLRLLAEFDDARPDVMFIVGNKNDFPTSGRILITEDGRPAGIIEVTDLAQRGGPEALEVTDQANLSVYLFKAEALYSSLSYLTSDNAQGEEYLTDIIGILFKRGRSLKTLSVDSPRQVMAFNTPEELERIRSVLAAEP